MSDQTMPPRGTPSVFHDAARRGARLSTLALRARGWRDEAIRRTLLGRFKEEFAELDEYALEGLIAAVQRGIGEGLAHPARGDGHERGRDRSREVGANGTS